MTVLRRRKRLSDPVLAAKLDADDRAQAEFDRIAQETADRLAAVTIAIEEAAPGAIVVEIAADQDTSVVHAITALEAAQRR